MPTKSSATPEIQHHPETSLRSSFIAILLVVLLCINALSLYLLLGNSLPGFVIKGQSGESQDYSLGIKKAILEVEYEKIGGKANYDLVNAANRKQLEITRDQIEQFVMDGSIQQSGGVQTTGNTQSQTSTTSDAEFKMLTPQDIKKILDSAYLEGSKTPTIVVIEYSDTECVFCMRQYHVTKLFPNLLAQYKNNIAVAFKNNRGRNHSGTEAKAIAILCAGKVGGSIAYNKYYKGVMDQSENNDRIFPVSELPALAKRIGLDMKKWQECYDKKETLAQFSAETDEAQNLLGFNGTPGTLLLNVKTGKYTTVAGAYPYTTFTAKIDELLK